MSTPTQPATPRPLKGHIMPRPRFPATALAQPFELCFAILFTLMGAALVLRGHQVRVTSVQQLPTFLVIGWEICLLLGGPLIAAGLFWRGTELMARAFERSGLYLAAAAWATYATTLLFLVGGRLVIVPIAQAVTIAGACLLRAHALRTVDRVVARQNGQEHA